MSVWVLSADGLWVAKAPGASLPFPMDWSSWLAEIGLTALDSVSHTVPAGITKVSEAVVGGTVSNVILSGGTLNNNYKIKVNVIAGSFTNEAYFTVRVKEVP